MCFSGKFNRFWTAIEKCASPKFLELQMLPKLLKVSLVNFPPKIKTKRLTNSENFDIFSSFPEMPEKKGV